MLKQFIDPDTGAVVKTKNDPSCEFVDIKPKAGSLNGVTSDGVAAALGGITDIEELIPEGASAENKLATESEIGSLKNGGVLTDADLIEVPNNKYSAVSTGRAAVELRVSVADDEVPNFAVEITATGAVTLTVSAQFSTGAPVTLYPSVAGGNALESGKFYQVTCVGNCWTLAEFTNTP